MEWRDSLIIALSIISSIIIFLIRDQVFALSCIFLTHLFILPSLFIMYKSKTWWLFVFMCFSLFASLMWHLSKEWFYEENLLKLDIIHQNLLIALSISLIVFKHVPKFMIGVLFTYTIVLSLFCLDKLWGYDIYFLLSGVWIVVLICHLIYVWWNKKDVQYTYLAIMIIYTCVAVLLYESASGDEYNSIHSIWHILAYTSLYFSFKMSFNVEDKGYEEIVIKRDDFQNNIVSEIRQLIF